MTAQQEAIMVVDDELDILSVIKMSLERIGMKVHGFQNPIAALEHIKKEGCPDCWMLISDVRMPQLSGFELVRKMKQLRPDFVVLLMTAFEINKDEFDKVLPSTEVDGFIPKPAKLSHLVDSIRRYESMRQKT